MSRFMVNKKLHEEEYDSEDTRASYKDASERADKKATHSTSKEWNNRDEYNMNLGEDFDEVNEIEER